MIENGTNVGGIFYECSIDTANMIRGQREAQRALKATSGSVDQFSAKLNQITSAIKLYAAALAVVKVAQTADSFRLLGSRVEIAAGSVQRGTEAMAELQRISTKTQTALESNAQIFARLNSAILQMGGTQRDTLQLTDLLAKAIRVSGASAQEGAAALMQFGQALGSGKLQGDEFRSMMENAPYLMQRLADSLGVPIGELRRMSEEGKLTSDLIVTAFSKAADRINSDFAKVPQTVGSAFTAMTDAAARASAALDDTSGVSAMLSGALQGLSDVLDSLAQRFGGASDEADKLGKNNAIKGWADGTVAVLSWVVDAADFVTRGFRQMGTTIGGVAAAAAAAARGELREASEIMTRMQKDVLNIGAAPYSGAALRLQRAALANGTDGSDPMDRRAAAGGGASGLKGGGAGGEKPKGKPFDAAGYLADLRQDAADEMERIALVQEESLRRNQQLLEQGKINERQAAEASVLIAEIASKSRTDLMTRETEQRKRELDRRTQDELDAIDKLDDANDRITRQATDVANPLEALRQEYEARLKLVTDYEKLMQDAGIDATEQGLIARRELETAYEEQRLAMAEQVFASQSEANAFLMNSVNALGQTATGAIMGLLNKTMTVRQAFVALGQTILQQGVGMLVQMGVQAVKTAMLEKTLAATKGAAYAASVTAQVTGMSAMAAQNAFAATAAIPMVGPFLAPGAAAAAGAAATALGAPAIATAPVAGARRYGGPVGADRLYRVNEAGAPEMYTSKDGRQYMLPTRDGSVTPADRVASQSAPGSMAALLAGAESQSAGSPIPLQFRSLDDMISARDFARWARKSKRDFALTKRDAR